MTKDAREDSREVPDGGTDAYYDGFKLKDNPFRTRWERKFWSDAWKAAKWFDDDWKNS